MKKILYVLVLLSFLSCENEILIDDVETTKSTLKNSCSIEHVTSKSTTSYRYSPGRLITTTGPSTPIKVYSELVNNGFANWTVVLNKAIDEWNSTDTCIRFVTTTNIEEADVRIYDGDLVYENFPNHDYPGGAYWGVEYPASRWTDQSLAIPTIVRNYFQGDYHSTIFIDTDHSFPMGQIPTQTHRIALLVHELGHSIGFMHETRIDQTPIPNIFFNASTSLMAQGIVDIISTNQSTSLTSHDELAVDYLYDCQNGVFNDPPSEEIAINLNEVDPACPTDFNVQGTLANVPQSALPLTVSLSIAEFTPGSGFFPTYVFVTNLQVNGSIINFQNLNIYDVFPNYNPSNSYSVRVEATVNGNTIYGFVPNIAFNNDDCDNLPPPSNPCDLDETAIQYSVVGLNLYQISFSANIYSHSVVVRNNDNGIVVQSWGGAASSSQNVVLMFNTNGYDIVVQYDVRSDTGETVCKQQMIRTITF